MDCPRPPDPTQCPRALRPLDSPPVIVRPHPEGDVEVTVSATTSSSGWSAQSSSGTGGQGSNTSISVCAGNGDCVQSKLGADAPRCECDFGWSGANCTAHTTLEFSSCS